MENKGYLGISTREGSGKTVIHRYEITFSAMYNDKVTDLQSVIIPASSLEDANEKLKTEIKRRLGHCEILLYSTHLYVAENERYGITN